MATKSRRHDWGLIIAGVLLLLLGLMFLVNPVPSLVFLTAVAGILFLFAGVFGIINYVRFHKTGLASGWTLFYAILDILIGLMFLIHPVVLMAVIPVVVGIFILAYGIFEIIAAFKAKKDNSSLWGWMIFSGILEIIIALLFFFFPATFAVYIAVFLLLRAITLVVYGWNTDLETL